MESMVSMLGSDLEEANVVKKCAITDHNATFFNLDMAKLKHEQTKILLHDVQLEDDMLLKEVAKR